MEHDETAPEEKAPHRRRWARLYATYVTLRWVSLLGSILLVFVVVTALGGGVIASTWARVVLGAAAALAIPWLLRGRLRQLVARRMGRARREGAQPRRAQERSDRGRRVGLGGSWFLVTVNTATLALLCLGFCDDTGRALRRRGDWFLGEADGWLPRRYRDGVSRLGSYLERFDLPPEARGVLADAARPQPAVAARVEVAPPPENFEGPPPPPPVRQPVWFHPLAGPRRHMPPSAGCRFGAHRPGRRPPECELGHCGVDMLRPTGTPVYAVYDGVVEKLVRDEKRGKLAGKFVVLAHKEGKVLTSYVHLHSIPDDLALGMEVRGGETVIGTVGKTGTKRSAPHLHFAVAIRRTERWKKYIDPEPLLMFWRLPEPGPAPSEVVASLSPSTTQPGTAISTP
jgi:murein DD-endopeptidase MepM/ murein hydrolase activator NlpD